METVKIVAKFKDGRMLKGTTNNFWPGQAFFHLKPAGSPPAKPPVEVLVSELKAIFFVRSHEGNSKRVKQKFFPPGTHPVGQKMQVIFTDGETVVGASMNYDRQAQGFSLIPADAGGNNLRIFVVNQAVREVRVL